MNVEICSNGKEIPPFWLSSVQNPTAITRTKRSRARFIFLFRIVTVFGLLFEGASHDFLSCVLLARRQHKRLHQLSIYPSHINLRVQIFFPNGRRAPLQLLIDALNAMDAPVPSTVWGCPTHSNLGQLVSNRTNHLHTKFSALVGLQVGGKKIAARSGFRREDGTFFTANERRLGIYGDNGVTFLKR